MKRIKTLIGSKIGKLTVLEKFRKYGDGSTNTTYLCECECGNRKILKYCNLKYGNTKSCGCLQKELLSKRSRKEKGHSCKTAVWNYYKRNANTRNIEWSLTKDEFICIILNSCFYCGIIGRTHTQQKYGDELKHNGVDRKDNDLGYTIDNSVSCCSICNRAKASLSVQEFLAWVKSVAKHNESNL